jgi:Bacterial Ig-like domain (group 3)
VIVAAAAFVLGMPAAAQSDLTVDVLINSANTTGYNTSPTTPGEYQRYPERYLEHLQVPYRVIDVSTSAPASVASLATTPLIIAGHRGLNLTSAWQLAIATAVQQGAGFVNLDSDPGIGADLHMQQFFGCSSSAAGTPGTAITLPATFLPDGATPHYITGLQMRFPIGNPASASGDLVYNFHQDDNNVLNTATATVCLDSHGNAEPGGTVLAKIGNDALITVTTFGSGNAVNFGSYDNLRADRFGFVMGLDDLFWRSLVWAARKPFVMRGHPRFFAVQEDDTVGGWGTRVQEMFNTANTGSATTQNLLDGTTISTGGPWRVTGNAITTDSDFMPGSTSRQTVLNLVNAGTPFLRVTPQAFSGTVGGDLFWSCPCPPSSGAPLSDSAWLTNFNNLKAFQTGNGPSGSFNGGNDFLPFATQFTPHFWDISDNTGADLQSLGFRYITEIQQPIAYYSEAVPGKTPEQRLPGVRPFRLYEQPPAGTPVANPNELWSVFWADDYTVHSRSGESPASVTFFGFATQLQGMAYPTYFAVWPDAPSTPDATALENWQAYIWRFWSGMAPVQIYTQDPGSNGTATEQQNFITALSTWMGTNGASQNMNIFMDDLGAYLHARVKSTLSGATLNTSGPNATLTLTLTGNATDGNGNPTNTYALIFLKDDNGNLVTVPGFPSSSSPFTTNPITLPPLPVVETQSKVSTVTNPSTFGAQVTFNASVTSAAVTKPAGNISLFDGNTNIATTTLDSNGSASFSTSSLSVGTHSITVHYAGDATHSPSTSGPALTEIVNRAASSTAVSGGGTASFFGNPVTFNATVTSTVGTPTGTVSLLDGSNSVASATLDGSGHASFSISTLTVGTHTISVAYGGDADHATSNSSTVSQTVNPADFSLSATGSPVTVPVGQSGTATITVTPMGVFSSGISFSCSGLPAESNCSFNPPSFTPNGTVTSTTATLTTTAPSAVLPSDPFGRFTPLILCVMLTGIAGLILLAQQRRPIGRLARCGAAVAAVLAFAALMSSCGGGGGGGGGGDNGNPGTPRGTSTVVVTATSAGNVNHQVNITFTVQ